MGIQLTLNPIKGYGLLLAGGELAEDYRTGRPYFVRTKRTAKHACAFMAPTWASPQVVAVDMHEATRDDELPTYVIGEVVA
jgi:hypothetical protein